MSNVLTKIHESLLSLLTACSSVSDEILFKLVPHPQVPKERPYTIEQVDFSNRHDGTILAGELTYPHFGKDFPGVVLISGHESGAPPASRDYIITGHEYFLVISHLLTLRGYAVLRYDNRGVGESSGEYVSASDMEFSSDAAAALKWLREDSGVKTVSSGFFGHSQGGSKALIAATFENPDFIVSLAGIGIETVAEAVVRQHQEISEAKDAKRAVAEQQNKELEDIFEILHISQSRDQARLSIRQYAIDAGITNEKQLQKLVDVFGSVWWYSEAHREAEPFISNYKGPVLSLYGSKDLLVSASVNEVPTRQLLRHPNSKVHTFDNLNHLFQTSKKGIGPEEYWQIETTIEEYVVEEIDRWLKSTIGK